MRCWQAAQRKLEEASSAMAGRAMRFALVEAANRRSCYMYPRTGAKDKCYGVAAVAQVEAAGAMFMFVFGTCDLCRFCRTKSLTFVTAGRAVSRDAKFCQG